jgi:formylglycine-generating enzyme required for sulfatase activity
VRAAPALLLLVVLPACAPTQRSAPDAAKGGSKPAILIPKSGGEMVLVPGGQFTMGDANGRPDETPHFVRVSPFYMDKRPVSQQLYEDVMGVNPSKQKGSKNPVERIQWTDAALFCNKCSEREGLTPCYDPATWKCDFEAGGYRLPTEAEWEYACRAGSGAKYFFGDDEKELSRYAWVKPHSRGRTWPVGSKPPNRWGLHDMHGNVWQWCNDFYGESYYKESPAEDPKGPPVGDKRVLRGGAWSSIADQCRAAYRSKEFPVFTDACFGSDSYGLRRARSAGAAPRAGTAQAQTAAAQAVDRRTSATAQASPTETPKAKPTPAPAGSPAAAPDRKIDPRRLKGAIVFVSDRGGAMNIWKMDANGGRNKRLTNDPYPDADPRFSPDGKRIMYTSLRGGFPEIWMMNRDGTRPERIAEGCQAAWSPDGNSIVFIRDDRVYIRRLRSGAETRVTPPEWERCGVPAWSPDGKRVAVASRHLQNIGIFLLTVDGKEHLQLAAEEPCCTPQWSADGATILFQTVKGHIHQIDLATKSEEQLTFGADIQHDARYSPDGSMIVFCRAPTAEGPWQLCIADLESDNLDFVQITNEGSNRLPDWHRLEDP